MKNETELANFALTAISKGSLNSIEDPGKSGELCSAFIESAIKQVLSENLYWACIVRETMYPNGDPLTGWSYRYELPTDFVRKVAYLDQDLCQVKWDRRGNGLFANVSPLIVDYVRRPTDIGDLPEPVAQAIGYTLALLIGPGLDVENDILGRVNAQRANAVSAAILEDDREAKQEEPVSLWGSPRYS